MKNSIRHWKSVLTAILLATSALAWSDELLSGPYHFDGTTSVHVKPAMLGAGWGMTLGISTETVINAAVTAGAEINIDIPIVEYPNLSSKIIQLYSGGLRLGAMFNSADVLHPLFNNTVGVGLVESQTYVFDEVSIGAEINVTKGIRIFATGGYRFTYGINDYYGLADINARGLYFDLGLRYGEIGK